MPPSLSFLTNRRTSAHAASAIQALRTAIVAIPHLAAILIMLFTEHAFEQRLAFLFSWVLLNCLLLVLLRRPALSGAISLATVVLLIALSELKYKVLWMTVSFVDLMVIDKDSIGFLLGIFPGLRSIVLLATALAIPIAWALWTFDPFRIRRHAAALGALASVTGLIGISYAIPLEPFRAFYGDNHVSGFARSGVDAISALISQGFMESDPVASEHLAAPSPSCQPTDKPPHIILVHDESSFDIRRAPGIKVPSGYGAQFQSFDGRERNFIVEGAGGPSWYTEYNVLAGLSARTFGRFAYFVSRIAAGRVERGLPNALRRCGYHTFSIYPAHGGFMSAASFQKTLGVENFYDASALGAGDAEPDDFYYRAASRLIERNRAGGPMFIYVYLAANHFPWDYRWRPDLATSWKDLGNNGEVDEYLRRQTLGMRQYNDFLDHLKKQFSGEPFLLVRYGDHQPDFASTIIEPRLDDAAIERRIFEYDPRYYTTYYAIDALNFHPVNVTSALDTIEGPYLPLIAQEAAGIPLEPSFAEQKKILERCHGLFYACSDGAEARRFNRLLIDAGLIKGL
jgi:hypothetical protein